MEMKRATILFALFVSEIAAHVLDSTTRATQCDDKCYKKTDFGERWARWHCEDVVEVCEVRPCNPSGPNSKGFICAARSGSSTTGQPRAAHIRLHSAGFEDGNKADIILNRLSVFSSHAPNRPSQARRGLNVAVVNERNGRFWTYARFDTYASARADIAFQKFIHSLPVGRIVLIVVKDEASNNFSPLSRWLCEGLGSIYARRLSFRDSWTMIGRVGGRHGTALESFRERRHGPVISTVLAYQLHQKIPNNKFTVRIFSSGFNDGNAVDMHINSISVFTSPISGRSAAHTRGIHVAVINPHTAQLAGYKAFDVYLSSASNTAFQKYVRSIPQGCLVLIAIRDSISPRFDRVSRALCRELGSATVDHVRIRDSWAMIGKVGGTHTRAIESFRKDGNGPATVSASLPHA